MINTVNKFWRTAAHLRPLWRENQYLTVPLIKNNQNVRKFCTPAEAKTEKSAEEPAKKIAKDQFMRTFYKGQDYEPVDIEKSILYLSSRVFKAVYQNYPVWYFYRRNFKGHFPPIRTRPNCVRSKKLITSNPCPICRDNHLVLDHRNYELIKHFVNEVSGEVLANAKTGLCQHQHKILLLEYEKAVDLGNIITPLPFVLYDYTEYYDESDTLSQLEGYKAYADLQEAFQGGQSNASQLELPPSLASLLHDHPKIDHAQEFRAESSVVRPEPPRLPNRYRMEEDYKKLLLKRRRAKSILL